MSSAGVVIGSLRFKILVLTDALIRSVALLAELTYLLFSIGRAHLNIIFSI